MKHLKITSIILSVSMCMSMIAAPVSVFADETPSETKTIETAKETEPKETEKKKPAETKVSKETEKPAEETEATEATQKPAETTKEVKEPESSQEAEPAESKKETESSEKTTPEESAPSETVPSETKEQVPEETEPEQTEPSASETVPVATDKKAARNSSTGKCGDNLTWNYNSDTHTLTISGTGPMYDYDPYESTAPDAKPVAPWQADAISTFVKKIVIENGVTTIGDGAFANCTVETITIPNSVISIGEWSFYQCDYLKELSIPSSVKTIGWAAFRGCSEITRFDLPNGITRIPDDTFMYCTSLTKIKIPKSVNSIGYSVFSKCESLTDIYYAGTEEDWNKINWDDDFDPYEHIKNADIHYEQNYIPKDTYKVTVNSGTANVESAGAGDTVTITANTAPDGKKFDKWVVNEGDVTLVNPTSSETTFTMPAKPVTVTATYKDLYVASGNITEDIRWTLDDKGRLVILGIGAMPDWADKSELPWNTYLDSIKEVTVFTGITNIGDHAFAGCKNITRIEIPMSVVKIGVGVLEDSSALKNIYYNGSKDDWDKIVIDASNTIIKYMNIMLDDGTFIPAEKRDNTLKVTGGKTAKVKYKKLRKKAQSVARGKLLTVSYPQGKLTFRITSVSKKKYKKYFKINASTGTVTVKKKLKKGTYTIKVTVSAAGNDQYKSVTKSSSFKIKVK